MVDDYAHIMTHPGDIGGSRTIKSVEKMILILNTLMEVGGVGISELAEHVGMSHGSVHHYLMSMQKHGYVVKRGNEYHLGIRFLSLGGYARNQQKIFHESREKIDELARKTGETARLVIESQGYCITLYQSSAIDTTPTHTYEGFEDAPHSTAAGKAILSTLSHDDVNGFLDYHGMAAYTENTITGREELYEELEAIRERGYSIDDEERFEGVFGIASPISIPNGPVRGAVSVSAFVDRIDREQFLNEVPGILSNTSGVLQINHTYSNWEQQ